MSRRLETVLYTPADATPEDLVKRCLEVGRRLEDGDPLKDLLLTLEDYVPAVPGAKIYPATLSGITELLCWIGLDGKENRDARARGYRILESLHVTGGMIHHALRKARATRPDRTWKDSMRKGL